MAKWIQPKFEYGQHVKITPLDDIQARVVDIYMQPYPLLNEYDVRYFENGDAKKVRVFEDELHAI